MILKKIIKFLMKLKEYEIKYDIKEGATLNKKT